MHLNLVRSVNNILDLIAEELEWQAVSSRDPLGAAELSSITLADAELRAIIARLAPLRSAQASLERQLGAASTDETFTGTGTSAAPWKEREFGVRSRSGWKSVLSRLGGNRDPKKSSSRASGSGERRDDGLKANGRPKVRTHHPSTAFVS